LEIRFGDGLEVSHFFDVLHEFLVKLAPEDDDRKVFDFAGLDQGHGLEEFIERAEPSRNDDKCVGVFDEERLPNEEVANIDPLIQVGVVLLLHGQHDIAAHRAAPHITSPPIGGFHQPRPTSGHDGEAQFGDLSGELPRCSIIGIGLGEPR